MFMINIQQGQIRVGRSGPVIIGEQPPENVQTVQQELPKAMCRCRQRSERSVRRLSTKTRRNRKGVGEQKMRASLSGPVVIEGQIIEESQITRQGSTRFVQPSTVTK